METVRVKQLIGSRYLWSHEQGLLVSETVLRRIYRGEYVEVDFSGTAALTLQFLNSAVGNLVRQVPWKELGESISFVNSPLEHARLFEAILIVWMEIEFDPRKVVKKTPLMEDMAFLFTPFEKRSTWRKDEQTSSQLRSLSA